MSIERLVVELDELVADGLELLLPTVLLVASSGGGVYVVVCK